MAQFAVTVIAGMAVYAVVGIVITERWLNKVARTRGRYTLEDVQFTVFVLRYWPLVIYAAVRWRLDRASAPWMLYARRLFAWLLVAVSIYLLAFDYVRLP